MSMRNPFSRFVALILVTGLLLDPVTVSGFFNGKIEPIQHSPLETASFESQALTLVLAASLFAVPIFLHHQDPFIQTVRMLPAESRMLGSKKKRTPKSPRKKGVVRNAADDLAKNYRWDTLESAKANLREAMGRYRPDLIQAYDNAANLTPSEMDALREEFYRIQVGDILSWGLSGMLDAPYFHRRHGEALQVTFPNLQLNLLGFQLAWDTREKGIESVRFVLQREHPQLLAEYDRLSDLSQLEIDNLKKRIYRIKNGHFNIWSLQKAGDRRIAPYFEGSYINALQAVFPLLKLNRLGFVLEWSTEAQGIESVRYVLARERPDLISRYERLKHLGPAELHRLREAIYRLTSGHLNLWGLSGVSDQRVTPYFQGIYAVALQKVFQDLELDTLGFKLDWSTRERSIDSIRYVLNRQVPSIMARYNRLEHLSVQEKTALLDDIYQIDSPQCLLWGLSSALNSPYFEKSYIKALQAVFSDPRLGFDEEGLRKFRREHQARVYRKRRDCSKYPKCPGRY